MTFTYKAKYRWHCIGTKYLFLFSEKELSQGWENLPPELNWAYEEENWQKERFGFPPCVCFLAKRAPCEWSWYAVTS